MDERRKGPWPRPACFLTLLLAWMMLAACSASVTPSSTPSPASQPTIAGPIVIPFFTTEADPTQLTVLRDLIGEYQNLHPNIEIDIILASPASRGRRLLTALASGADLGIFEIEPTLMTEWADAGYLLPLDDVVAAMRTSHLALGLVRNRADHVEAQQLRPLRHNQADTAGGRMQQDGVARLEIMNAAHQV